MAHQITFGSDSVRANNSQFSVLFEFALQVAKSSAASPDERDFVSRMERLMEVEFWPGRWVEIETDFPELAERKFWARVFLNVARGIFERELGDQVHHFWQAQRISQAYGLGLLFEQAAREHEPRWTARSLDRDEFEAVVNGRQA